MQGPSLLPDLNEAIHAASNEHLAIWREAGALCVALGAELDGTVQKGREAFHLVLLALRRPSEQVKGCAGRKQPLRLLPAAHTQCGPQQCCAVEFLRL